MFWKKKKTADIEIPGDDKDLRAAYRVKPDQTRPIIISVAGNSYQVENISGTGCSFRSHRFSEGSQAAGTLKIPSEDIIFPVTIHVVSMQRDLCHCEFSKISPQAEDAIHFYVLNVQKYLLRSRS